MRLTSSLILVLVGLVLSGCFMSEQEPAPPKRAAAPVAAAAPSPPKADSAGEPQPAAAPRDGVEASSLPLSGKGPQRRAPAISSAPNPTPVAPIAPLAASSSLDIPTLRAKLMATDAMGPMTKLAIANALDDLAAAMNAHAQGQTQISLARLRASLDRLTDAIGSLIQNRDTPLYITLRDGRAALWASLSAPKIVPIDPTAIPAQSAQQVATTYDDLAGAIVIHGESCPFVSSFQRNAETDWVAHCGTGPVFRVFADAQDRVQVVRR